VISKERVSDRFSWSWLGLKKNISRVVKRLSKFYTLSNFILLNILKKILKYFFTTFIMINLSHLKTPLF
jgi:hypothetical protein